MARDAQADQVVAATRIVFEPSLVYLPRPFCATQQVPSSSPNHQILLAPILRPPVQVWSCAIGPSRSGSHRLRPLTATIVFRMCHEWLQYLCVWCKTFPLASIHYRSKIPRSPFFVKTQAMALLGPRHHGCHLVLPCISFAASKTAKHFIFSGSDVCAQRSAPLL